LKNSLRTSPPVPVYGAGVSSPAENEPALPAARAFVVQLQAEAQIARGHWVGPPSHVLDARPLLPYLTGATETSIRTRNFTQTGTNLRAPGVIPPCVLNVGGTQVCTQLLPFKGLCETEGGVWFGDLQNCCQVVKEDPTVTLLPHDDSADLLIIQADFGHQCPVVGLAR
jgi:hypothetical protein